MQKLILFFLLISIAFSSCKSRKEIYSKISIPVISSYNLYFKDDSIIYVNKFRGCLGSSSCIKYTKKNDTIITSSSKTIGKFDNIANKYFILYKDSLVNIDNGECFKKHETSYFYSDKKPIQMYYLIDNKKTIPITDKTIDSIANIKFKRFKLLRQKRAFKKYHIDKKYRVYKIR